MIEDEAHDAELAQHQLRQGGFEFMFRRVDTKDDFLRQIQQFEPTIILSDHGLPAFDGFSALHLAQEKCPNVPFIFVTGSLGEEMAINALKSGAADFVLKNRLSALPPAVHRALDQAESRQQRQRAEEELQSSEERYRRLVELSPDALFVQSDDKIVFINTAGVKLLGGRNVKELIGKSALSFVHPDYRKKVQQRVRKLQEEQKAVPFFEHKIVR